MRMLLLLSLVLTATANAAAPHNIPATMHAAAIDATGGPEVLTLHTLPVPKPGAGEILIELHTASVAIWDAEIRQKLGLVKKPAFPFVMGSDGAGIVAVTGAGVEKFKVGDAVYAYCWDNPKGGFYAEYIAVPTTCVERVPKTVKLDEAGALGASGLTAWQGVVSALALKRGETVIIHGASGAVGTLAIQIAKRRGAKVLATASGDDGLALVKHLGADAVVDGRKGDILAAAKSFAPQGVDAVLAFAGGDSLERCLDALKPGGRVAFPYGVEPVPKARDGVTIKGYNAIEGPEDADLARLNEVVALGAFEVPIAAEFLLANAAKAHERLAAGHVLGKILLRIR